MEPAFLFIALEWLWKTTKQHNCSLQRFVERKNRLVSQKKTAGVWRKTWRHDATNKQISAFSAGPRWWVLLSQVKTKRPSKQLRQGMYSWIIPWETRGQEPPLINDPVHTSHLNRSKMGIFECTGIFWSKCKCCCWLNTTICLFAPLN